MPQGFGLETVKHSPNRFSMPVTINRFLWEFVETYEIPIEHDCNLNPCKDESCEFYRDTK